MIKKVHSFIEKMNMFEGCDHIIVGLSGGADSVCLINLLYRIIKDYGYNIRITAVHVNHGIRGEEASFDEEFAKNTAQRLGVAYEARFIDVTRMAKEMSISVEDAGRRARYEAFRQIGQNSNYKIAVAHHMDDMAETVLMNIMRGASVAGAGGISPVMDDVIRPLLCVRRSEIEDYLHNIGEKYVTDSTNSDCNYTRNRIRNILIPYMKESFNPNVVEAICNFANDISAMSASMNIAVSELMAACIKCEESQDGKIVNIIISEKLLNNTEYMIRQLIYNALKLIAPDGKDIYRNHINAVYELLFAGVSKKINLPKGIIAKRCYDRVEIYYAKDQNDSSPMQVIEIDKDKAVKCSISVGECVALNRITANKLNDKLSNVVVTMKVVDANEEIISKFKNNDYTKIFDYDKINSNLYLRFKEPNDKITIGDNKQKKLNRLFIDNKVPVYNRDKILLLCDDKHCLWAVGVRRSDEYMVDKDSKMILIVSVEDKE